MKTVIIWIRSLLQSNQTYEEIIRHVGTLHIIGYILSFVNQLNERKI